MTTKTNDSGAKRLCEYCESGEEHREDENVVFIGYKPFCIISRSRLWPTDGDLDEEEEDMDEAQLDELGKETIEPLNGKEMPNHPYNPAEWRIVKP